MIYYGLVAHIRSIPMSVIFTASDGKVRDMFSGREINPLETVPASCAPSADAHISGWEKFFRPVSEMPHTTVSTPSHDEVSDIEARVRRLFGH